MAIPEYAFTERYVVPGGAGLNDGTSWANAWDITQVAANIAGGFSFNFSGNFSPVAALNWNVAGSVTVPVRYLGWELDQVTLATLGGGPIIDFVGLGAGTGITPALGSLYHGLRLRNGPGIGMGSAGDWQIVSNCEFSGFATQGYQGDDNNTVYRCRSYDNGGAGFQVDRYNKLSFCESYGNTGHGFQTGVSSVISGSYARGNDYGFRALGETDYYFITSDGNNRGIECPTSGQGMLVLGGLITNNNTGITNLNDAPTAALYCNFFGNTTESTGTAVSLDSEGFAIDPDYLDIISNNYEIQETTLIGVGIPGLGSVNVGAWQGGGGGGGGTFLGPVIKGA